VSNEYIILGLTFFAGSCMLVGALIAHGVETCGRAFRHFVVALGGGILLGGVAVVLVPKGLDTMEHSLWPVALILSGGFFFFILEQQLGQRRLEAPQVTGMVLDFVPEAIALGGLIAVDLSSGILMAVLIALQNIPEGFNALLEMRQKQQNTKKTLLIICLLVPLGPAAGLLGYYVLADEQVILAAIMLFASGGILYLIFQDIAPQAKLRDHWLPPLGAVFGFCIALAGEIISTSFF